MSISSYLAATPRRLVLMALPAAFRTEYGSEIVALFAWRVAQERGPRRLRVALLGGLDLIRTALRLRFGRRERPNLTPGLPGPTSPLPNWTPDMILRDLRFAVRTLLHRPIFSLVVILTLALGIGANALIYSVVDAVVLNPFDFPEPDRVVTVGPVFPKLNQPLGFFEVLSAAEYDDIRQLESIENVVGFDMGNRQITGGDVPENVRTGFWWGDPLPAAGLQPVVGRSLPSGVIVQDEPVAMISERVWHGRFAADPAVVGSTIQINDRPHTLIGVFPDAAVLYGIDLWTPMWAQVSDMPRNRRQFQIIAGIREGADLDQVNAVLDALARRTELAYGAAHEEYQGWRLEAMTWTQANVRTLRPAAMVLLGSVGFVLLLVCANVASLVLARAAGRRREIAVRAAVGAGRGRIVRQLMSESLLLAVAGGTVGVGLAFFGLRWLAANTPPALIPTTRPLDIDLGVLGYTLAISLASGLLFGLAPALQGSRLDLQRALTLETGQSTGSRGRRSLHGLFVAVEVALALLLLVGAGLFITSFARLQRVDPGLDPENVLTMRLTLPAAKFQGEGITNFFVDLARLVEQIPGVEQAASGSQFTPIGFLRQQFSLPDLVVESQAQLPRGLFTIASADYFETLGIRLQRGRTFTAMDLPDTGFVAVINATLAGRYFPGESPVGKRIKLGTIDDEQRPWLQIIGVVDDTRNAGLHVPPQPEIYVSLRQVNGIFNQLFLIVRTEADPMAVLPAIRDKVAQLDPGQAVYGIATLESAMMQGYAMESFAMVLLTAFGFLALMLAAIGIFGVVSYAVSERTREIGVRMALGAGHREVRSLIIRQALVPVAIGATIGLVASIAAAQALAGMLYEIRGFDPGPILTVAAVLAAVAVVASYLPARQASTIDPLIALRQD